jgi:hypothetical protein
MYSKTKKNFFLMEGKKNVLGGRKKYLKMGGKKKCFGRQKKIL